MEHDNVMLIYHGLSTNIDLTNEEYFNVHSGCEIWLVSSFRVLQEIHQIMSWVFYQVKIHKAQGACQLLVALMRESFKVVCHLATYTKTKIIFIWVWHGRQ